MAVPSSTPPSTPTPTAQPKQRASAVPGAATVAKPRLAAAASPIKDLRMDSPKAIGPGTDPREAQAEVPRNTPEAANGPLPTAIEDQVFGGSLVCGRRRPPHATKNRLRRPHEGAPPSPAFAALCVTALVAGADPAVSVPVAPPRAGPGTIGVRAVVVRVVVWR